MFPKLSGTKSEACNFHLQNSDFLQTEWIEGGPHKNEFCQFSNAKMSLRNNYGSKSR